MSHQLAFFVAVPLAVAFALLPDSPEGRASAIVYGVAVAFMFGASGLYHRIWWSLRWRPVMRRVDHAGVYLLIAGSYTPVGLLILHGNWRPAVLAVVWTGAALAILAKVCWVDAPKWLAAAIAIALGWIAVLVMPQVWDSIGFAGCLLLIAGGIAYTVGGIIYATERPNPRPGGVRLPRGLPRAGDRRGRAAVTPRSRSSCCRRTEPGGTAAQPCTRLARVARVLERLAHFTIRRRWWVIGAWVLLMLFGMFASSRLADRWFQSFSIPGYQAYETNQKTLKTFGSGEFLPLVAVFHSDGDVTKQDRDRDRGRRTAPTPGSGSRVSSYFSTGSDAYVSKDRHTTFAEIYPPGNPTFTSTEQIKQVRAAIRAAVPEGVTVHLTGRDPLYEDVGGSNGPSLLLEILIGGIGALLVLLFVFGTLPAVVVPLLVAACSILTTFSLVWALTYVTDVSIIVQYLVALVGLGVAIDYSLLMIFRFREELHHGRDAESAIVETMIHAGRSVIVSGSTVAIGLLSMILLPLPFIRSIGIGGMLIPAVSVIGAITLVPAHALRARPPHRLAARDPEADHRRRPGRDRLLASLGRHRRAPAAPGGPDRPRRSSCSS